MRPKTPKKDVIILAYKNIVEKSFGGDLFNCHDGLILGYCNQGSFDSFLISNV